MPQPNTGFDHAYPLDEWGQRVGWLDRKRMEIGQHVYFHASDGELNQMLIEAAQTPEYTALQVARAISYALCRSAIYDRHAISEAIQDECARHLEYRKALHRICKRILREADDAKATRLADEEAAKIKG